MRAHVVTVVALLFCLILGGSVCETASAVGPLRRLLGRKRCQPANCCELKCQTQYRTEACQCHLLFPGNDPVNQISRCNCLKAAYFGCLNCVKSCQGSPCVDPCGKPLRVIEPHLLATCAEMRDRAFETCKRSCLQNGGSEAYCNQHCNAYKNCVYQSCLVDPDLIECAIPFPSPIPTPLPLPLQSSPSK